MPDLIEPSVRSRILASGLDADSIDYFEQQAGNADAQSILSLDQVQTSKLDIHQMPPNPGPSPNAIRCIQHGGFALVVLNGGMATRFGGVAKGTVEIQSGMSFLGAKLKDALKLTATYSTEPPQVFLMCSSATNAPTLSHLKANDFFGYPADKIILFNQCESIRFTPDGRVFRDERGQPSFHGTGHGDLPYCIREVPEFKAFCERGKAILLSNVDNVLATADLQLMEHFLGAPERIVVEVVDKNQGDVGGGPLVVNGRPQLVEAFRLPSDFDHTAVSVFNTNTFWLEPTLFLEAEKLPWHRVQKRVGTQPVIQFERLVGEITNQAATRFVRVSRSGPNSRFLAVKTPDDLESNRTIIMETWLGRAP